jgi:hypothetical protein
MSSKLTLKNQLVYDFFRKHLDDDMGDVKTVFMANKTELARRYSINTYATFNMHVRKCREWEAETGNKVTVIRLDNREVIDNGGGR